MKIFLGKIFIFLLIFALTCGVLFLPVYYFNPDDYFGNRNAPTRDVLSSMTDFKRNPSPYIILGDSRMNAISWGNLRYFNEVAGERYANLAFGGASQNESIDMFWWSNSIIPLKKVYLGVSFYDIQENNFNDRLKGNIELINKPWRYVYNYKTLAASLENIKLPSRPEKASPAVPEEDIITETTVSADTVSSAGVSALSGTNAEQKPDFVGYADNIYAKCVEGRGYEVSALNMKRLKGIADYCRENEIELIIVTPPYHVSIDELVLRPLGLNDQIAAYKEELARYAELRNMEFLNDFSYDDSNFIDGFHLSEQAMPRYINAIISGNDPMIDVHLH